MSEAAKILRYLPPSMSVPYWSLDYNKSIDDGRLEKRDTYAIGVAQRGSVIRRGFYQLPIPVVKDPFGQPVAWGELIVEEVYLYTYDAFGFAIDRNQLIYWMAEDGTVAHTKNSRPKLYFGKSRTEEGKRRRETVRAISEEYIVTMLLLQAGSSSAAVMGAFAAARAFVQQPSVWAALGAFTRYSSPDILEIFATDTSAMLDSDMSVVPGLPPILSGPAPWTARRYLANWFNIWGLDAATLTDMGLTNAAAIIEPYAGSADNLSPPA